MDTSPNTSSKFETITAIKDLIAKNKTEEAIKKLKEQLHQEDTSFYDELILVSSVFEDLDTRIRNNLVEFGQINIEKAKINNALIKIANKAILEKGEKKTTSTAIPFANLSTKKKTNYLIPLGIGIMLLMLVGVGYLIYQNSNTDVLEITQNQPNNFAAIPVSNKDDVNKKVEIPKKETTTDLAVSGKWKMLFYYKKCTSRPNYNNNLTTSYKLDLTQNNLSISGKGKKYAESYNGKNLVYSKEFKISVKGTISDDEIKLTMDEVNTFGGVVNGEIILLPHGEDRFIGTFELNDYGCEGRVELKPSL